MSFNFSPKIVTDGLVLYLDAGNARSYVSGSTVWYDLSKSQVSGTLVNGPIYNSNNNGSIVFDGVDDYVELPSSNIYSFGTGNFTITFWIKTTDTDYNIINPKTSTGTGFWGLLQQASKLRWNNSYNVTNLWEVNNTTTLLDGNWHNVVITRTLTTVAVYYDTISQSLTSTTDNNNYNGQDAMRISSGNLSPLNGRLSQFTIYQKALSASEILQNYNATKSRFGL